MSITTNPSASSSGTVSQLPASGATGDSFYATDALTSRGVGSACRWNGSAWINHEGIIATTDVRLYLIDVLRSGQMRRGVMEWCTFDDFLGVSGDIPGAGSLSGTGAAAATSGNATAGRLASFSISTGTTATGRADYRLHTRIGALGNDYWLFATSIKIGTLSNATDEYHCRFGFDPNVDNTYPVYAAFLVYDRLGTITGTASNNWQAVSRAASTQTVVDTGVAVDTNYHNIALYVPADKSYIKYYVDGTEVANITTNIPTVGSNFGIRHYIEKTAGTTSRAIDIDWRYLGIRRGTALTLY